MNIITGASGQVGSAIVKELSHKNLPVRAVIRNAAKLPLKDADMRIADLFSPDQLIDAFDGGTTVFLLTPESPQCNDIIGETKQITANYKKAIQATGIRKIVGLSSVGAHVKGDTGNILMSQILEHTFDDLDVEKIFIRPSYYYSNWLGYLEAIEQFGVLPTFFPKDFKIHMNSPLDVAKFVADAIAEPSISEKRKVFELVGPQKYSSREVAETLSHLLRKNVETQPIPKEKWQETLLSVGLTKNTSLNISDMTQAVIDGIVVPESEDRAVRLPTSLYEYFEEQLNKA